MIPRLILSFVLAGCGAALLLLRLRLRPLLLQERRNDYGLPVLS